MRNNKMNSSDRKMDSANDREVIFGLGWGLVCCGNEVGRVHFEIMDSDDDLKIFPLVSGGGEAMRSVCPWTSSFRKMDSSDDRELIFGLECW